jgi:hypothetical protein
MVFVGLVLTTIVEVVIVDHIFNGDSQSRSASPEKDSRSGSKSPDSRDRQRSSVQQETSPKSGTLSSKKKSQVAKDTSEIEKKATSPKNTVPVVLKPASRSPKRKQSRSPKRLFHKVQIGSHLVVPRESYHEVQRGNLLIVPRELTKSKEGTVEKLQLPSNN